MGTCLSSPPAQHTLLSFPPLSVLVSWAVRTHYLTQSQGSYPAGVIKCSTMIPISQIRKQRLRKIK